PAIEVAKSRTRTGAGCPPRADGSTPRARSPRPEDLIDDLRRVSDPELASEHRLDLAAWPPPDRHLGCPQECLLSGGAGLARRAGRRRARRGRRAHGPGLGWATAGRSPTTPGRRRGAPLEPCERRFE